MSDAPSPPADRPGRDPVLVVGAGVQGLTFALALARAGRPVILAEGSPSVGGQARSFRYGDYVFDVGLHAFVSRDPRVLGLARSALPGGLTSFLPRAATRLANGSFVEDSAEWLHARSYRHFYDLLPRGAGSGWNCMAVSEPPRMVYPSSGGFGGLCEGMARELARRGGLILTGTRVGAADLEVGGGRLLSARLGGRRVRVSGCYWTAGARPLAGGVDAREDDHLVLHHFLARGPAAVPYHWVRLHGGAHPLLPRLAYFPARFSPRNAPPGGHGVGAVVPLPAERRWPKGLRPIVRWCRESPRDFEGLVRGWLEESGVLRPGSVLSSRTEVIRLPVAGRTGFPARLRRLPNFWIPGPAGDDRGEESGVPLQMASSLRAADAALAGRLSASERPARGSGSSRSSARAS